MNSVANPPLAGVLALSVVSTPALADHYDDHWYHGPRSGPVAVAPAPAMIAPQPARVAPAPTVPSPSPAVAQSTPPDAPQMWYYCDSAKSYHPYVPTCPSGWRAVPAVPNGAPRP